MGIVFASVLIHAQLGLREALFESCISLFKNLNADIVVINKVTVGSTSLQGFDRNRLALFERYPQVVETFPIRYDFVRWQYPGSGKNRLAIMIGFNPRIQAFNIKEVIDNQQALLVPDRILYDELSRKEFGAVKDDFKRKDPLYAFVNDRRVRVAGLFRLGTSFSYDASLMTSIATFESLSDNLEGDVEIGLVRLAPGTNASSFLDSVRNDIPGDVNVFTLKDFLDFEKSYWDQSKPIGFVFAFNAALGFIVGMLILYQILYTDVSNHLSDFSTMLALAYTYGRIRIIVFQESLYLVAIGYPIGLVGSVLLFSLINNATGLQVKMSVDRALICFALIVLMSSLSALMAMQKLDDANPIEVFE
jgi:putative ABC transport system permease protein